MASSVFVYTKTILRCKMLVGKSQTLSDLHRTDAGCAFLQNAFSTLHILRRNRDDVNVTAPAAKPLEIPNFRFATLADKIHHWVALSGVDRPAADFFYSAHAAYAALQKQDKKALHPYSLRLKHFSQHVRRLWNKPPCFRQYSEKTA